MHRCYTILRFTFFQFIATGYMLLMGTDVQSQNLFANSGFEDINTCTEYHAPCAPEAWFYLNPVTNPLVNGRATPIPLLGHNFLLVPVANVYGNSGQHPVVYSMLLCALVPGETYRLRFFLNSSKRKFYELGFCFTESEPGQRYFEADKSCQRVTIHASHLQDAVKNGWQLVECTFVATAAAKFCMLGNLGRDNFQFDLKDKMSSSGNVYYFLDDLKLTAMGTSVICEEAAENTKKNYEQNFRHSEYVSVAPPEEVKPVFVTDTIRIPAVFFETGKATLLLHHRAFMDSLLQSFSGKKIAQLRITGHTDNQGDAALNSKLSIDRANSIRDHILMVAPELSDIITSEGKASGQPRTSNATAAGRAMNRRVEIVLTYSIIKKK